MEESDPGPSEIEDLTDALQEISDNLDEDKDNQSSSQSQSQSKTSSDSSTATTTATGTSSSSSSSTQTESQVSATSSSGACIGKRDGSKLSRIPMTVNGDGSSNHCLTDNCEIHTGTTEITKSIPKQSAVTVTCTAKSYSQACYHYYSVIENYPWVANYLTCTDSHGGRPKALPATNIWEKQHRNRVWRRFTAPTYTRPDGEVNANGPMCERDEFPPAYFMPRNGIQQDLTRQSGQLIRWLPREENGGAGNLWQNFCKKYDGGKGNGQYGSNRDVDGQPKINDDLVDLEYPGSATVYSSSKDGTTTYSTVTKFDATYSNAVFHMDFDWDGVNTPSHENDWNLQDNPCWPKDIEPENPGYVLLNEDKWYYTNLNDEDTRESIRSQLRSYTAAPKKEVYDAALDRRNLHKPDTDPLFARNVPLGDGLNVTGEVINCRDAYCTEELKELDEDENITYIPGKEPTITAPSVNYNTIPTQGVSSRAPVSQHTRRDRAVPDVPVPTGHA